jgi:hypothetical protein
MHRAQREPHSGALPDCATSRKFHLYFNLHYFHPSTNGLVVRISANGRVALPHASQPSTAGHDAKHSRHRHTLVGLRSGARSDSVLDVIVGKMHFLGGRLRFSHGEADGQPIAYSMRSVSPAASTHCLSGHRRRAADSDLIGNSKS